MSNALPWLVVIHLALLLICALYAALLQRVYRAYHPDRTWMTVVGGEGLVGIALAGVCATGALPWEAAAYFITLQGAAGIPIILWQLAQAERRRDIRARLERDESHAAQARRPRDA